MNSVRFGAFLVLFVAFVAAENDTATGEVTTQDATSSTSTGQDITEFASNVETNETVATDVTTTKVIIDKSTSDIPKLPDYIPSINETEEVAEAVVSGKRIFFKNATNETKEVANEAVATGKEIFTNATNKTKEVVNDAVTSGKEIFKNVTSKISGIIENIPAYFDEKSTEKPIYKVPQAPPTGVVSPADGTTDAIVQFTVKNWYEKAPIYVSIEYIFGGKQTERKSEIIPNGTSSVLDIPAAALTPWLRVWYIEADQNKAAFGHYLKVTEPRSNTCLEVCNYDLPNLAGVPTVEFCSKTACGRKKPSIFS